MLNREEILIKVMQILDLNMQDIKLKQSIEKKRFTTFEQTSKKTNEQIKLIFKALNLDKANSELIDIFRDLIYLYEKIEKLLLYRLDKSYEQKINWIILKRLVVPYLVYRFANLDREYDNRIDKNMSGGLFWYLPDLRDFNDIKMPIQTLMKWWLDLYGRGLDSLCNEIDEQSNENQAFESINTLKPWLYKNKLPKRVTIGLYLSQNINYKGFFKREITNKVSKEFERCKDFVQEKGLTAEILIDEIPERTLINKIFENKEILKREKEKFIKLVSERWSKPYGNLEKLKNFKFINSPKLLTLRDLEYHRIEFSKKFSKESLIFKFIIARAVQDLYGRLVEYFDIEKDSIGIEENKVLQLINEYQYLYNLEISVLMNDSSIMPIEKELAYEYLEPFYQNNFENIIKTISSDINIELQSPLVSQYELEDMYKINILFALNRKDEKLFEKSTMKSLEFDNYFHQKFDKYQNEVRVYHNLSTRDFDLKLQGENDFRLLSFLFHSFELKDYTRAEKTCLRIDKLARNNDEKLEVLSFFIKLYTRIDVKENIDRYKTVQVFLEEYLTQLNESSIDIESDILLFQIGFYLKSKNFKESLVFCEKYFSKFILNQKKEELHTFIFYISAYCAYTCKDKQKLKKYNKFLKKYHSIELENQKSLPFTIYFYK